MFIGGHIADRIGRRGTIVLSMFSSALLMVALSQARGFLALAALAALAGTAAEMYRPASLALMTDFTPQGERITAFALFRTATNAGIAAGPAVAGFLAQKSFLWIFLGDAATSILFGFVALLALPRGRPDAATTPTPGGLMTALRTDKQLRRILVGMSLAIFVIFQIATTLPLHMAALGLSTVAFGLVASMNGLMVALIEIPSTSFTVRLPPRIAMGTGFLVIGVAYAGLGLAGTLPLLMTVVAVATLGEVLAMPVTGAFVADLAPHDMRGRYQGALGGAASLGVAAAPPVGGALYGWHPNAAFAAFALAGILAFLVVAGPALRSSRPAPTQ